MKEENRFMTVRECVQNLSDLRLSELALRRLVRDGRCPGYSSGCRFYVDTTRLREMLEASTAGHDAGAGMAGGENGV